MNTDLIYITVIIATSESNLVINSDLIICLLSCAIHFVFRNLSLHMFFMGFISVLMGLD